MLWKLPLRKRFISMSGSPSRVYEHLMCVNGIGLFVETGAKDPPDPATLGGYLVGEGPAQTIVEAPSVSEAVALFHATYEAARTGQRHPALWLDLETPIELVLDCEHRRKVGQQEWVCGDEAPQGCILNRCDPPDFCPIKAIKSTKVVEIDGFRVEVPRRMRIPDLRRYCKNTVTTFDGFDEPRLEYRWEPLGDGYTLHRLVDGVVMDSDCGRLNTNATGSTRRLAHLYNSAQAMLEKLQEMAEGCPQCKNTGNILSEDPEGTNWTTCPSCGSIRELIDQATAKP